MYEEHEYEEEYEEEVDVIKHSGLGITSFVLAILTGLAIVCLFVIAGIMGMEAQKRGAQIDDKSPLTIILGLMIIGSIFMCFLSFALGIASLFQRRKKVFPILGTVFSLLIGLGTIGLIILGLIIG